MHPKTERVLQWLLNRIEYYAKDGTRKTVLTRRENKICLKYFRAALAMGQGVNQIAPDSSVARPGFPAGYAKIRKRWAKTELRYAMIGFASPSLDYWMRVRQPFGRRPWSPNNHDVELFVVAELEECEDPVLHSEIFEEWYGGKTEGHFMRLHLVEGRTKVVSTVSRIE